jgi:DNA-binding MarR family transcriptional regulator
MPKREETAEAENALSLEELPLTYLAQFVGAKAGERVLAELRQKGHATVRPSHGYVIQHLLGGPRSITELAELLGVTQQAVSKSVGELARAGYVKTVRSEDARVRRIALSARGLACVEATREARRALEAELSATLGKRRFEETRKGLIKLVTHLGLADDVRLRRIRPPE